MSRLTIHGNSSELIMNIKIQLIINLRDKEIKEISLELSNKLKNRITHFF